LTPVHDYSALLDDSHLHERLTQLAAAAGDAIMAVAAGGVAVRHKADQSPVTTADEASEAVILAGLASILPTVPVVSEESVALSALPDPNCVFALVDPLDGTAEFVAGRPEFTVNIAIVAHRRPIIGVLAAPALGRIWRGVSGRGAARLDMQDGRLGRPESIRARPWPSDRPLALVSRSHLDAASAACLDRISGLVREPCGSALKFCRLAEGSADIYPRLAPTSEWDVAAGDAILEAAGGAMRTGAGRIVLYGNADAAYRVSGFIAVGDPVAAAKLLPPP
jgi:3'(2'), 5'-bisphosphate nucleotidase